MAAMIQGQFRHAIKGIGVQIALLASQVHRPFSIAQAVIWLVRDNGPSNSRQSASQRGTSRVPTQRSAGWGFARDAT